MSNLPARQEPQREPTTMELIGAISSRPDFDSAKMDVVERLIALKERTDAQDRKNQYAAAMAALQAELPQIDKSGRIMAGFGDSAKVRSTYARIEDIDSQIRPYLAKHGFSFSWNSEPSPTPEEIRYTGTLTHEKGHAESKFVDLPIEDETSKEGRLLMTRVQKRGATLSYAVRTLLRMHLNLVMREEDNDAQGNVELVTAKDLAQIRELMAKCPGSLKDNEAKFLAWIKAEKFEDMQRRDVPRALSFLRAKAAVRAE